MSTSKTSDKPFMVYEQGQAHDMGFALIQRNTSPSQQSGGGGGGGERRGRRKQAEPGSHTKQYNSTNQNPPAVPHQPDQICKTKSKSKSSIVVQSNNDMSDNDDHTSFFFSNTEHSNNSGYLGCIVPDNCLNPPNSNDHHQTTSTNSKYTNSTSASNDLQNFGSMTNQSHCNSYAIPLDTTSAPADNLPYFGGELNHGLFWGGGDHDQQQQQQPWELNPDELSAIINNPVMVEADGYCMGSFYNNNNPNITDENPSSYAGLVLPQATSSTAYCSPSVPPPPFGDVVDFFGYSLF
ncbi:hypothetical protein JRO89_XS03G0180400 [Xanthoceras sorbifolium]|uniref:Uncharacterized protein n=1 Tax=Xanthoceras sorbifolium TaxID=99658 RepID=A0ABQ8IBF6_9ROSI|nr:hypothetical protein JRO89_XS03G0180400 [Xanthoceras sorbifolium]